MSDELQFHLAARANDLVERRSISPEEAKRIARLEFGCVEKYKEEARQSLGLRLVDETGGDLRYAFRSFAKNKTFTLAAVGTLALGIGANTAVFSVISAAFLNTLPISDPETLTLVRRSSGTETLPTVSYTLYEGLRDQSQSFRALRGRGRACHPGTRIRHPRTIGRSARVLSPSSVK